MSTQDLEQRARELLAAEYADSGDVFVADRIRTGAGDFEFSRARRAIVAALRQQSAPVDLEQFREAVEALLPFVEHSDSCGDHDANNNASVPSCGCGLLGAREHLLSLRSLLP